MDEEFDTSVDTPETIDASDYADDFYDTDIDDIAPDVSSDVELGGDINIDSIMSDTEDSSSYADDFYDTYADDITPDVSQNGDAAAGEIESLMDDVSDDESVVSSDVDSDIYQATPLSEMEIVQEDGSVDTLENIMAANADTDDDTPVDVDPYQATPLSEMEIVQEDGSVDTLENIMAANADTDDDMPVDVDPYQATPISEMEIVQEDGSVDTLENIMATNADTDTVEVPSPEAMPAQVGFSDELNEVKSPDQKIQEQIDLIMENQNLSNAQKSALLTEMQDMLPQTAEANADLQTAPLQNELETEIEEIDDGVPVKVLTLDGTGTGLSHHDYQQELADLDQGIANWSSMQQDLANSLNQEITGIKENPDLSDAERDFLLAQAEQKRVLMEEQWDAEAAKLMADRDVLQQKVNDLSQENGIVDSLEETAQYPEVPEVTDTVTEIQAVEDISTWIGDINPNFDPYDWDSPYCNNCGSCAFAVEQRFEGNTDIAATSENIGTVEEMNALTGMEQVAMSPEEIQEYLISQGPGSHGIVGIDRVSGPGHWFNAYYDGQKVVAIDGQTGEVNDWPPDYGDVTNWDISVRKEAKP